MMFFFPKTCFFTGHRNIKAEEKEKVKKILYEELEKKIKKGFLNFISGGAQGFDMMAQQAVLDMRSKYPDVRLCLYLPCSNQAETWNDYDKQKFFYFLTEADEVFYVSREKYFEGCMKKRNQAMVEACDCGIAYVVSERSGSGQTVRMAEERGIEVVKIII